MADDAPTVQIRRLGEGDADAVRELDQWAFASDLDDVDTGPSMAALEWDRTFGAYLDDARTPVLAGITSTYSFDLPVPGSSLTCGGLTWVGVHPQYRRRGVMSAMVRHHLAAVRERGEPVSALHAAEPGIYGRFGYGVGSRHLTMTLRSGAGLREVTGADGVALRLVTADAERHADLVGDCYDAARRSRPGMVSFGSPALRRVLFDDQPKHRGGFEPLRLMIAGSVDDRPVRGYALFRRREAWTPAGTAGVLRVKELVARDPAAASAMWRTLLSLDLVRTVEPDERPTDDPLLTWLHDPRAPAPALRDGLWVRLVDVPAALRGRRFSRDVDVVLEVDDRTCPWNAGRWRLRAVDGVATCEPTAADPDLCLAVADLSAAYLGSTSLMEAFGAGAVRGDEDVAIDVAAAMAWPVAAYCGRTF